MKKFLVPLLLPLLLSCSNEGFESKFAASAQKDSVCGGIKPDDPSYCPVISESLCKEIGGTPGKCSSPNIDVSSSSDDVSSSSSVGVVVSSSSAGVVVSSSSIGGDVSSSSVGGGVSSSSIGGGDVSSSSVGTVSSSSSLVVSSSSSAPPSLGACSVFPYYVVASRPEPLKNLVPSNGCGNITYSLQSGSSYASISSSSGGYYIRFNSASSGTERNLTIRGTSAQCGSKDCPIKVVFADDYRDVRCNHDNSGSVNLNNMTKATAIDYACCESKLDYYIKCPTDNYTLKITNSTISKNKDDATGVNLPDDTLIEEPDARCAGGFLYRYPKRILMTVTGSGGLSCDSW